MGNGNELLPARMLNEWAYCPRLAVMELLHGEWRESADTEDGNRVHRRVDHPTGDWPSADEIGGTEVARALWLSAPEERITARMDLVEAVPGTDGLVRPVDYKRGPAPDSGNHEGLHEPECVQLAAQALVLRSNGYRVEEGILYFAASRQRVSVRITDDLVQRTRQIVHELLTAIQQNSLPPPLVHSPKCDGCSLAPLCLPDEINLISSGSNGSSENEAFRRLVPARDDALPLHVLTQGARIGVGGSELIVRTRDEEIGRAPIPQTSQVALFGNVQITTQALHALFEAETPVAFFTRTGWFLGTAQGLPHRNVFVRQAQFRAAADPARAALIARRLVAAKLRNQRTMLRRNAEGQDSALVRIGEALRGAEQASSVDVVRGHEGEGAAAYFGVFASMIRPPTGSMGDFDFQKRKRRPPSDPVNAILSFGYALLVREWTHVLTSVGLDPFLGFLHTPHHGRPALALDLMEEFRPIVADSVAISMVNTGELASRDFVSRGPACNLSDSARRKFLGAWERRLDTLVTHPIFGYKISYRRVFEVQARLFGRYLLGEIDSYPPFLVR